jgi:arsenate reductase (thioredoxin)
MRHSEPLTESSDKRPAGSNPAREKESYIDDGRCIMAVRKGPRMPDIVTDTPAVLFVCVHNAGRSQMAAGYLTELAGDRIQVFSAGSEPASSINPVAIKAMAEDGIDIAAATPKILDRDAVQHADVVITMGCGDACPIFPGKRYEDWDLDDPAGADLGTVRRIRDEIKARVQRLIIELDHTTNGDEEP